MKKEHAKESKRRTPKSLQKKKKKRKARNAKPYQKEVDCKKMI